MRKRLWLVPITALFLCGATFAEDMDGVAIPAVPYIAGGQSRFFPVAKDLIIPPGGHVVQVLNVFNMERVSVQAVGNSVLGEGALVIRVGFGPPLVGDPGGKLELTFSDSDTARASATTLVRGPRMAVEIGNDRAVPVKVSVGAYATN